MNTESTHMAQQPTLSGGLYLVPSPLGNLNDLTFRAVEVLKRADLVVAEDTRRSLKLLNHLNLKRPLVSYREQNHHRIWPKIAQCLETGGRVALLTDAGAPAVSDPGADLTEAARASGFNIIPLPGPSAVITALMASGFSADRFTFAGFLPSKRKDRRELMSSLSCHPWTLVFFETPHRLTESLKDMAEIFGRRQALLAREMTKIHEEYFVADLAELAADVSLNPRKGEITIAVQGWVGSGEKKEIDMESIKQIAESDPRPVKVLAAELAQKTGRGRSEMYQLLLAARQNNAED